MTKKKIDTVKAYRRGNKAHYAELGRKSVDARIKRHIACEVIRDDARVTQFPTRKRESDAGYDVTSPIAFRLDPGQSMVVKLGLQVRCPKGYFYKLMGRSSLTRIGLVVDDNTIDATYTGELEVCLRNFSDVFAKIEVGDRIAQLIFLPQIHVSFKPVTTFTIEKGDRAAAGFGSSGKQ